MQLRLPDDAGECFDTVEELVGCWTQLQRVHGLSGNYPACALAKCPFESELARVIGEEGKPPIGKFPLQMLDQLQGGPG